MSSGWRNWRGDEIINTLNINMNFAINKTLETILTAAKGEVPLDEGILQRSGKVIMSRGKKPGGAVCFGGGSGTGHPKIPYAIKWHQHSANFQRGRKRFYLRDPFHRLVMSELQKNMRGLLS